MNIFRTVFTNLCVKNNRHKLFGETYAAFYRGHVPLNTVVLPGKCLSSVANCLTKAAFLTPHVPLLNITCGLKVKGRPRRRCKDCYFVVRQERLYVMCKTHPRHKQMAVKPREKDTWILTHATQGEVRPW